VNEHPLRNQGPGIKATDRLQAEESVVVDMGDEKADLIHVAGEHDPGSVTALGSYDAAQRVNSQLIDEGPEFLSNNCPHPVLTPGYSRCRTEPLQQFEVHAFRHIASRPPTAQAIRHRRGDGRKVTL
jgi:hypothetical protein